MNQMPSSEGHTASGAPRSERAEQLAGKLDLATEQLRRVDRRLLAFVRAQPLVAAGSALAVGFVVGRVLSRRH